jgi:glycosyltransferase involved in cell wall biosynthesis
LHSLARLAPVARHRLTLLVIDNSTAGNVRARNADVVRATPFDTAVEIVHEPRVGISFARNTALDFAHGTGAAAVVFLDDDQTVPPEWLDGLVAAWTTTGADAIKCAIVGRTSEDYAAYDDDGRDAVCRSAVGVGRATPAVTLATNGVLIARRVYDDLGMRFDPSFALTGGGDYEFFHRARTAGATLIETDAVAAIEWRSGNRGTVFAHFERGFHLGVCRTRLRRYTKRSAAGCAAFGLGEVAVALATAPIAVWRRRHRASLAKRLGKGAGAIAALAGIHYQYYRTAQGAPVAETPLQRFRTRVVRSRAASSGAGEC